MEEVASQTTFQNAFQTLLILENSSFMWTSAPEVMDLDTTLAKSRADGQTLPLPPVKWTWMTWSIEALFEYCRIAWDIVPHFKVSIYGCDNNSSVTILPIAEEAALPTVKVGKLRELRTKTLLFMDMVPPAAIANPSSVPLENIFRELALLESEELLCAPIVSSPLQQASCKEPFYIRIVLVTSEPDRQKLSSKIMKCLVDQNLTYLSRYEISVIMLNTTEKLPASTEKPVRFLGCETCHSIQKQPRMARIGLAAILWTVFDSSAFIIFGEPTRIGNKVAVCDYSLLNIFTACQEPLVDMWTMATGRNPKRIPRDMVLVRDGFLAFCIRLHISAKEDIFVTWYTAKTGFDVVESMKTCVAWDLRLSRTVVTDIPMKEDAKTGGSTSFSFNVDLFHPWLTNAGSTMGRPEGDCLRMKWVRPVKGSIPSYSVMDKTLPLRASPSDPTTRPTQCLVGYVVDGNAVLLESQETAGMACKLFLCGGKICLQQLKAGADKMLEDIPSLAELPGGRVGTYRVQEMVSLVSSFLLDSKTPFPVSKSWSEKADKLTTYFPLVYNETAAYLPPQLLPVLNVLNLALPRESDWEAARDAIIEVVDMEKKLESLPGLSNHPLLQHISSTHRKSESYAVLWAELDMFLEANSHRSAEHEQLRLFLNSSLKRSVREELKIALRERLKSHIFIASHQANGSSDVEMEPSRKRKTRPDFEGRLKYGRYGKLYQNLQKSDKNTRDDVLIHASLEL